MGTVTASIGHFLAAANATTTGGIALSSSVPAGNTLVVGISGNGTAGTIGCSDTKSNTWVQAIKEQNSGTTLLWSAIFVSQIAAGKSLVSGTDTVTVTDTTSQGMAVNIDMLAGWTNRLDGSAVGAFNTTGSPITLSALPVHIGSIVFMVNGETGTSGTFTPGSGFTSTFNGWTTSSSPKGLFMEYQIATSTSVTPSLTPPASQNFAAAAFALLTVVPSNPVVVNRQALVRASTR